MNTPTGNKKDHAAASMVADACKKAAKLSPRKNKKGASLVEYGTIVGLIAIVAIASVVSVGDEVKTVFTTTTNTLLSKDVANGNKNPVDIAMGIDGKPLDLTPFVMEVNTAQATIYPMAGGAITVDWGNAAANANCGQDYIAAGAITCAYPAPGQYQISIEGDMTAYGSSAGAATNPDITRVTQWGNTGLTDLSDAFYGATNLTDVPTTLPASVTTLDYTFYNATSFNDPDIGKWNISNVSSLDGTFRRASSLTANLSQWNTSNVTNMSDLFAQTSYNGDISKWKTGNVTAMVRMFDKNPAFAQSVSDWDVSKVTNMTAMFREASAFTGDLSKWSVSNVTGMAEMFQNATAYDGDLSAWCVEQIAVEPNGFASGTAMQFESAKQPKWGETCS
jgi:surface protein